MLAPLILLVVAGIVAGILTGTFSAVARRGLYATGLWSDGGALTVPPSVFASSVGSSAPVPTDGRTPDPSPGSTNGLTPVLRPAQAGPTPRGSRVAAKVTGVQRRGKLGSFSGSVVDAGSGKSLYGKNADTGYIPASTLKLLTTTAALSILGPDHEFTTKVVAAGSSHIILVGGGDPYLEEKPVPSEPDRATLSELAGSTAAQLRRSGLSRVQLGYDTSLFTGPAWHPDWPATYADQVTPVTALWVNEGRVGGAVGARVPDPAKAAAKDFAAALAARGVRVSSVIRESANSKARQLAAVQSLPLDRIVERLLMVSDNDAAEVVSRQAALGMGKEGSFAAGRQVVQARLTRLGAWSRNARIRDGSGLSRMNRVPAHLMADVLRLDLQPSHPELRGVITALPVAGVEGSLRRRFSEKGATAGRGLVRAKTGTLTDVDALAGYVRTGDGSLLAYAFLVNDADDYFGTRIWLDRVLSAISTCGCR